MTPILRDVKKKAASERMARDVAVNRERDVLSVKSKYMLRYEYEF